MGAQATRPFLLNSLKEQAEEQAKRADRANKKSLSVYITEDRYWKLKVKAAENHLGMQDIVTQLVDDYLDKPSSPAGRPLTPKAKHNHGD